MKEKHNQSNQTIKKNPKPVHRMREREKGNTLYSVGFESEHILIEEPDASVVPGSSVL